jgi:YjbE family integral membrane protein
MTQALGATGIALAVSQVIAVDILLGGDNAIVVALAARRLAKDLRRKAILFGMLAAIVLRVVFIFFLIQLLELPFVRLIGAAALLWIAIKLLQPLHNPEFESPMQARSHLWGAIATILVADATMSMDNVLAIAAAARGHTALAALGVVVSVPIIIWGSNAVLWLMSRFPIVITLGGALLGLIAGEMAWDDAAIAGRTAALGGMVYVSGAGGAVLVLAFAYVAGIRSRREGTVGPAADRPKAQP